MDALVIRNIRNDLDSKKKYIFFFFTKKKKIIYKFYNDYIKNI
jgi:hypothetical protein